MAGSNRVVGIRREFLDTNIGARIVFPVFTVNSTTADLAGSVTYSSIGMSVYTSALVSSEIINNTVTYESPAFHNNAIQISDTTVTITESLTYPRLVVTSDIYTVTIYTSTATTTYPLGGNGFYIIETLDGDWIFMTLAVFDGMYETDIAIPATTAAFGNIEHFTIQEEFIGWGSAIGDNRIEIGNALKTGVVPEPESDPYDESVEPSAPGGGDPTEDMYDSDDIDEPDDPEISAVSTGFISLWSPTEQQMLSLSAFMWNADFLTIDFWKKLIANPLDLIYGLNIVPMDLSPYIDGAGNVVVGLIDTHIQMNHLSTQWITVDCGSINVEEAWGAYLDYDPFTKLEIYLPFCGTHPLKMDDFMPGSIHVTYKIDLVTGTCVALIKSTKSAKHDDTLNSIVYQFMGNCATQVPVTAAQYSDAVRSAISIAASIGSMVAVGAGGAAAAKAADTGKGLIGVKTAGAELNQAASLVENVMNLKPSIEKSGALGSSGSLLAVRTPYLIFTRPRMARPQNQNVYTGYPSFITRTLGELNGWTKVQAIHLENIPCTSEEMAEIDTLLQTGVIM